MLLPPFQSGRRFWEKAAHHPTNVKVWQTESIGNPPLVIASPQRLKDRLSLTADLLVSGGFQPPTYLNGSLETAVPCGSLY